MKKLNFLSKALVAIVILLSGALTARAHDFEVDGIYYNITDETNKTVKVTYKGNNSSSYSNEYTGAANIPSSVTYNDTTYSVTEIGNYAFYNCARLTEATIPNSVTMIGDHAFEDCSGLTSVTIPNSVTMIGGYAFEGCIRLIDVNITNISAWLKINYSSINSNPLYYGGRLILNDTEITDLVIPKDITVIKSNAFAGCIGLTSVVIPNGVTEIGLSAFWHCRNLTSVIISNSVTDIGNNAFDGCSSLISVNIPDSVNTIKYHTFYGCIGLKEINIPNTVHTIEDNAFNGCSSLVSVFIPNSVNSIGNYTFYNCDSLKEAFVGCKWEANPQYLYNPLYRFDDSVVVSANLHSYENGKCTECGTTDPTGIDVIRAESNRTSVIYDLQGRRVVNPVKNGIYIVNGELKVLTD